MLTRWRLRLRDKNWSKSSKLIGIDKLVQNRAELSEGETVLQDKFQREPPSDCDPID